MPVVANLGTFIRPNSVSIFIQPPGGSFVALLLQNFSFPAPNRVRLDLAESEDVERRWSVPRNPVERLTAQNRIREPDALTIKGTLSANPIGGSLFSLAGLGRLDKDELKKLYVMLRSELSFIVTPERYYKDMTALSVHESYGPNTGNGVDLTIQFQEMLIASPGSVASALDLDALAVGAASPTDLGPQTPTTVPDPGGLG